MDKSVKIILAIVVVLAVIAAGIVAVIAVKANGNDTSLSGQLNKAMDTQGSVRIVVNESGDAFTFQLNKAVYNGSSSAPYILYKAHCDHGSIVLEKYNLASQNSEPGSRPNTVDYYSLANVVSISYKEDGTTYTWHR